MFIVRGSRFFPKVYSANSGPDGKDCFPVSLELGPQEVEWLSSFVIGHRTFTSVADWIPGHHKMWENADVGSQHDFSYHNTQKQDI